MRKKASFTLLELLLCTALFAFALGAVALSIPRFIASERFERDVKLVQQKIELVTELMLDCESSITLCFDESKQGIQLSIVAAKNLPKKWIRMPKTLKEIGSVSFDGERVGHLELLYDCEVGGCPRGLLTLEGKNRKQTLSLPGYPGKIKRGEEVLSGKNAPYPQEIFSFT